MCLAECDNLFGNALAVALKVGCDLLHPSSDLLHILFLKSTGSDGGSTHADTAGDEGLFGIVGNGVLVDRNVNLVQSLFHLLTGDVEGTKVNEHQVVIGIARYDAEALFLERLAECLGVLDDLLLIFFGIHADIPHCQRSVS